MTLDQIEMLEAILSEGSFRAAAEKLHKSQPSLSVGIKKMEEEYGIQLFDREGYRPQLTEVGRIFYEGALATLGSFRRLEKQAHELGAGIEPSLRMAIDPLVDIDKVREALLTILHESCSTSLHIDIQVLGENYRTLLDNEYDFAIGHLGDEHKDIESVPFDQLELIPVIAKACLGNNKNASWEEIKNFPQLIVPTSGRNNEFGAHPGARHWFVSEHQMKEKMILSQLGWGRVPLGTFKTYKDRLIRIDKKVIGSMPLQLVAMKHSSRPLGPIGKKVWQCLIASTTVLIQS